MKLSIEKAELQRGLGRIQSIVEKRNTMPILANVLLEARKQGKEGQLEFAATDLEVGDPRLAARAGRRSRAALTVSAKKLYEIVRELPDETVQLEATGELVSRRSAARAPSSRSPGASAEEYPSLPELRARQARAPCRPPCFAQMIERTMYAASADETRYNLNGVYLELIAETAQDPHGRDRRPSPRLRRPLARAARSRASPAA